MKEFIFAKASSRYAAVIIHSLQSWYSLGLLGRWSWNCRWSNNSVGLSLIWGKGVLQYCMITRVALSLFKEPFLDVLLLMIRLALFTPNSAHPLNCG